MNDPLDGLPVADDVHAWALEKHARLRKYVDITKATRKKFTTAERHNQYRAGATYIDLFCGPGRGKIVETGQFCDGSPLVALKAAQIGGIEFSEMHVADLETGFAEAASARIRTLNGTARSYQGSAETTVREIARSLNPRGLHFAFLDPYNLANLSFEIVKALAAFQRMDIMMHVSIQDMQRNLDRYTAEDGDAFDVFAPGWRDVVDVRQSIGSIRAAVMAHWRSLVRGLGYPEMPRLELIKGSQGQRLYWLAFISRHNLGNEFWNKIRNITGQGELGL
jgi:three-Cys-motif partner protein